MKYRLTKSRIIIIGALLTLVAFTLPFLIPKIHGKLVAVLAILAALSVRDMQRIKAEWQQIAIFTLIFLIGLVGLMTTQNLAYGLSTLENNVVIFVLPIVIFLCGSILDSRMITRVIASYAAGVILFNLISLFFISYDLWDYENLQSNLIAANNIIVSIHPTLLSMYISFCIFSLANQYFPLHKLDRVRLGWVLFSLAVLSVFLLWLNSRAGILAFLLASTFFVSYRWQGRTRIIGYASLALFAIILVSIPFSNYRFVQAPKLVLEEDSGIDHRDPNVFPLENRLQILKCNIELLKWPEILFGYGTGDGRDELQKCFAANNYTKPLVENMDSHSEYFAQLHRHGIIGLGLFLALLIVPFRHALRYKSPLLGAFIILFAVTAMFENVFSVQKGVTFFALFCPLLWLHAKVQFEIKGPTGPAEIPAQKA